MGLCQYKLAARQSRDCRTVIPSEGVIVTSLFCAKNTSHVMFSERNI